MPPIALVLDNIFFRSFFSLRYLFLSWLFFALPLPKSLPPFTTPSFFFFMSPSSVCFQTEESDVEAETDDTEGPQDEEEMMERGVAQGYDSHDNEEEEEEEEYYEDEDDDDSVPEYAFSVMLCLCFVPALKFIPGCYLRHFFFTQE